MVSVPITKAGGFFRVGFALDAQGSPEQDNARLRCEIHLKSLTVVSSRTRRPSPTPQASGTAHSVGMGSTGRVRLTGSFAGLPGWRRLRGFGNPPGRVTRANENQGDKLARFMVLPSATLVQERP